jgi:hypothetical protein
MSTVVTVNFGWVLPVPGTEVDLWGTILNNTFGAVGGATPLDNIDTDLWAVKGTADGALQKAGGTMTGPLVLDGGVPAGNIAISFNYLDTNYASLVDLIAYAPLASPTFSGNPQAPTPNLNDFDASIATTAFVINQINSYGFATLVSPVFTGDPTAPTPANGDNDLSVATTAFVQDAVTRVIENNQAGTAYTLLLTDVGKMVQMNNAAPFTLTIPPFTSVAFQNNVRIDLLQGGAGQVTVVPAATVTILSSGNKTKLTGQYSGATLWKVSTNIWVLIGDIAA